MATITGKIIPLRNTVLVTGLEKGPRTTSGGIFLMDDNGKQNGIRARWGQVWAVGPLVDDLKPGDWVLVKHGRWTYDMKVADEMGITTHIHRVEYPDSVELVSDEYPLDIKPLN